MNAAADHQGVSIVIGPPKEVQAQLGRLHAGRALGLAFEQIEPAVFENLTENVTNLAASMVDGLQQHQHPKSLKRLVEVCCRRCLKKRPC